MCFEAFVNKPDWRFRNLAAEEVPELMRVTDRAINMKDKTFLRGHQATDEQGKVEFMTKYPGGYMPRLSHIHVRLMWRDVEWTLLDTQLFLPPDVEGHVPDSPRCRARSSSRPGGRIGPESSLSHSWELAPGTRSLECYDCD